MFDHLGEAELSRHLHFGVQFDAPHKDLFVTQIHYTCNGEDIDLGSWNPRVPLSMCIDQENEATKISDTLHTSRISIFESELYEQVRHYFKLDISYMHSR